MAEMIPAFASAMQDPVLRGHPREVYIWMHEHLDVLEFRSVKHAAVADDLAMKERTLAFALSRLVERGYLDMGPKDGRLFTYRLFYSRPLTGPKLRQKSG